MTTANCPTCGGPIEFKVGSSFLVVCPHCRSAIARTDRDLKDLGKVAALVDTESPLTLGLQGKYNGVSFRLTGRAQLRHTMGGMWDEWYAAFSDNRWGWLAEAQGRFFLTFEEDVPGLPAYESLHVGEAVPNVKIPLVVAEKGSAKYAGADGEIPFRLVPNATCTYADLSGNNNLFATLDYSDGAPVLYAGKEVKLDELALNAGGAQLKPEKRAQITNLGCPNCGGSLELRAPDKTERVGCPHCGSLLDCSQGKFSVLQALETKMEQPLLKLGSEAEFEGAKQIVIGFMKRSCIVGGVKYFWTEYLLYNKDRGFRWLVHSDEHWTFVRPLQAAQVRAGTKYAYYGSQSFKRWQDAPATVELVLGEFYWKVEIGETVSTSDFISPPRMLSCEKTQYAADDQGNRTGGEINWSLGEYVTPEEIQAKFKLPALRRPTVPGACQPNPHLGWFWAWCKGVAAVFVVTVLLYAIKPDLDLVDQEIKFDGVAAAKPAPTEKWVTDPATGTQYKEAVPPAEQPVETPQVWVSDAFELKGHQRVFIEAKTHLNNAWLALEGDLIEEANNETLPFELNIEYWSGTEDGEAWSEGDQNGYLYIPAQPPGKYVMKLEGHWEKMAAPQSFHLKVQQTTIDPVYLFLALLGVSIIPIFGWIGKFMFESKRWSESMYGSSSGGDDDD